MLLRASSFDIKRGLAANRPIMAILLVFLVARIGSFVLLVQSNDMSGLAHDSFSLLDVLVFVNRGMDEFDPRKSPFFILDITWMVPQLLIGLSACLYPYKDLRAYALQTVTRIRSRLLWFWTKALWGVFIATLYYVAMLLLSWAATALFGNPAAGSPTLWSAVLTGIDLTTTGEGAVCEALFLGYAATVTTALFLTYLAVAVGPVWAYLAAIVCLILSAYFCTPLLFFEYVMIARNAIVLSGGFTVPCGLALCAGAALASYVGGMLISRKVEYI